jgi:fructose-bisphosphate aldolase class 1
MGDDVPTGDGMEANVQASARYPAPCQGAGRIPIVGPELLMAGEHSLERCEAVTDETLRNVFNHLCIQRVMLQGMILNPNIVRPGLLPEATDGGRGCSRYGWIPSQSNCHSRSGYFVPVGRAFR